MSYQSEVLADNPDWYYRFEELAGSFADSSGNGIACAENGAVSRGLTGALPTYGIGTDGSDHLVLTYTAGPDSAQTVEGWFRTTTTGVVVLESNRGGTGGVGVCLQLAIGATGFGASAGQVTAFFNATSFWLGIHTTGTVNDGQWHHIVATWAGGGALSTSQLKIYVDGSLATTSSDSNTGSRSAPISGSGFMSLFNATGGGTGGSHADVDADEMAFYASALSAGRIAAHYDASAAPLADFSASPVGGAAPLTVAFTDESTGETATSWLWDFGDGGTSTSQNPSHIYAEQGAYTVTLTVTTASAATDSETKVAYINATGTYVAPDPGGAILEIYASVAGSARWGRAHWGEDVWSSAQWVDVTPQGIDCDVRWGSHEPNAGILAEVEAATWLVSTYDPDRLMDPGNLDSPYHADLKAGLPIRIRHRGTIVRQGIAERIAFFHADDQGAIRATDNVSLLARSMVPADSVLSDTLRARARDAIAAAGLTITVEPDPPTGDPALVPRLDDERSVWRHIQDAAEQTLHMAYIDRIGTLKFRAWANPYDRARGIDGRNLVDLGTQIDTDGLYSVIRARDSITEDIVERRLTPLPRYGAVTFTRDELTIDAGDWAATVLADRGLQTVQWIPGLMHPLTADDVEYYATLEAMERFGVDVNEADPEVDVTGIIVGGHFLVKGKKDSAALWEFEVELAQTAESPLYTDTDPPEFLLNEMGDGYLYAD